MLPYGQSVRTTKPADSGKKKNSLIKGVLTGGNEGARTLDLLDVNEAL